MKMTHRKPNRALRMLCACLALLLTACAGFAEMQEIPELLEPAGLKMDTATAYIGEISEILSYDGAIVPYVEPVYFTVGGVVDEIHVIVGQEVKTGDPLISLDNEAQSERIETLQAEIELLSTNIAYAEALAEIDRAILETELQALLIQSPDDGDAIALKELQMEEFDVNLALESDLRNLELTRLQDELTSLQIQSERKVLTAPFDGVVSFLSNIEVTSYVNAYTPVMYIADDSRMTIETELLSETDIQKAHDLWALIGPERYEIAHRQMDLQEFYSQVLAGEAVMTQFDILNPDDTLSTGLYAAVCLERNYVPDALLVPTNAVYGTGDDAYVYMIEDGRRVRQPVTRGVSTDWLTQIREGLEEGAIVYVKE